MQTARGPAAPIPAMDTSKSDGAPGQLALNAVDTGRVLGISRAQVFKLHASGKLPMPVRLGTKAPRWRLEELKAWLAAGCPDRRAWEVAVALGGSVRAR
jgi:predicted DNA-binding transcriptional regulator AlpA